MRDHPIVLGTAGHIDHGKTSLVRALTGVDTDRLAVEKQRGITTELGFAPMTIGDRRIAVVDVPGHERFVKSMVAGATGLDLVVLVIAADEGVMPQTREHLDICHLLGVRRGVVALSKIDLVDRLSAQASGRAARSGEAAPFEAEWIAMVTADVRAALAGTFLADAPIVGTAIAQPDTLDALRTAIAGVVDALPPRETAGVFRLPIDRAFTIKGFGTVVTGTMLGGEVALGDEVEVIPSGRTARVRGIEVHGGATPRAHAGLRVALNLGGIAVDELARGELLVHPGRVAPSHILDVELAMLPSAAPLADRGKVLVHHAATQVLATLAIVDRAANLAQLRLDARMAIGAVPGDRFILRGFVPSATHGTTIGGGRVIRVLAPRARRPEEHAAVARALAQAPADARIALEVQTAAAAGLTLDDLVRRLGAPADALAEPLATLVASGELLHDGAHYLHATAVATIEQRIVAVIPTEGIATETVRGKLPAALSARAFHAIALGLANRHRLAIAADRLERPAPLAPAAPVLTAAEADLLAKFAAWGVEPVRPAELAKPVLDRLLALKRIVRIKPDLFMHAGTVADVRARLLAHLDAHATIDAAQWKALTGASRKFTIPLAEYFDAEKVTLRIGDLRRRR